MLCAETLRRLCSTEVLSETVSAAVTVSIGLSLPRSDADLATIMRLADQALYSAKNSGRNRVAQMNDPGELGVLNRRVLRLVGGLVKNLKKKSLLCGLSRQSDF